MAKLYFHIFFLILSNSLIEDVYSTATFTFVNKCKFTVWPGILSNAGISPLSTTGFALNTGESRIINAPTAWGGRFWGRTHCSEDSTGKFSCATGDCGSGKLECAGGGAVTPVTLAEFTLDGDAGKDFYDLSLVDGFNLPMLVAPQGGSGVNCSRAECVADLNGECAPELRVTSAGGERVACRSACDAFRSEEYCCSGAYGKPAACKPSKYAETFKRACPQAYSYAYDDLTSTFTCIGADYIITFCPSPNTRKSTSGSGGGQNPVSVAGGSNTPFDGNMVYEGALDVSSAASTCAHVVGGGVAVVAAMWRLSQLY
ncbi:thaumatin-like protein 1b isoform X2 [Salvia splendens]|uniref:thaumatin-like protein 1b isoform X2 n=1 Tax=Salvia splendens TaxID=180675 RepID=UPI001C27E960|nr:thaumatin-like protein 1b isoform X2 [Salvia splendens]